MNWIIRDVIRVILYANTIVANGLFEMLVSVFAYTKLIMSINILNCFIFFCISSILVKLWTTCSIAAESRKRICMKLSTRMTAHNI